MSKKTKKATPQPRLVFEMDTNTYGICGFCDAPRITRDASHFVSVIHTRSPVEYEEAIKKEAATKGLDLSKPRERAFAEREVGWESGNVRMQTLHLCSKCFAKVRTCTHCDYYAAHAFKDKSVVHSCHFSHITFCQRKPLLNPETHFCGDWQQAEPFAEEDILELLTKEMP